MELRTILFEKHPQSTIFNVKYFKSETIMVPWFYNLFAESRLSKINLEIQFVQLVVSYPWMRLGLMWGTFSDFELEPRGRRLAYHEQVAQAEIKKQKQSFINFHFQL
jgi:hypothetical protein